MKLGDRLEEMLARNYSLGSIWKLPEREADADRERRRNGIFRYSRWRSLVSLVGMAVVGIFIIAVGLGWRSTGSLFSSIVILGVGIWAVFYAIRRLRDPVQFVAKDGGLRVLYLRGRAREWRLDELRLQPPRLRNWWEGSFLITERASGQTAFRVFRDLPGCKDLCAMIPSA